MLSIVVACLPQTKHVSLRDVSASNRCILPAGVEACALVAASTAASQETAELHSIVQSYFERMQASWAAACLPKSSMPSKVCAAQFSVSVLRRCYPPPLTPCPSGPCRCPLAAP
jgi:hypothetical protein